MGPKMSFRPEETTFESRLFEALHREGVHVTRRQLKIKCKSEHCRKDGEHQQWAAWYVDFYIWPYIVIEVDGHPVRQDRDTCLSLRGLHVIHINNGQLMSMEEAIRWAKYIKLAVSLSKLFRGYLTKGEYPKLLIPYGTLVLHEEGQCCGLINRALKYARNAQTGAKNA